VDKEAHSADPERKSPINDLKTYWMYFRDFAKPNLEDTYKYNLKLIFKYFLTFIAETNLESSQFTLSSDRILQTKSATSRNLRK